MAVKQRRPDDVDHQPPGRDDGHQAEGNLGRARGPLPGFGKDEQRDDDQRNAVEEGGQDLETLVAVGPRGVGRTAGGPGGEQGPHQGHVVGQHVAGVGQQSQAV